MHDNRMRLQYITYGEEYLKCDLDSDKDEVKILFQIWNILHTMRLKILKIQMN